MMNNIDSFFKKKQQKLILVAQYIFADITMTGPKQ